MIKNFGILVLIIVLVFGIWTWLNNSKSSVEVVQPTQTNAKASKPAKSTGSRPVVSVPAAPSPVTSQTPTPSQGQTFPADQSFVVNASDSGADLSVIKIPKGTRVTVTFNVSANGSGHGGLDFRSVLVNTNTIAPGGSMTTSFLANQSFLITGYWPATNTVTPAKINVIVQ